MRQAASLTASLLTDKADGSEGSQPKPKVKAERVGVALSSKGDGVPAVNSVGTTSSSPIAKAVTKINGGGNLARPGSRRPLISETGHRPGPATDTKAQGPRANGASRGKVTAKKFTKAPVGSGSRIAMTLRLDHDLHTELKVHAAMHKKTAQQVLLEALEEHIPAARKRRKNAPKSA